MAKYAYTYIFKVSATNEGYALSQEFKPEYIPNEIIYTFNQKVEKIVECDNNTFVIKREDNIFRQPINLKNNNDVLRYQLLKMVRHYLGRCGVDKQDTCIVEYELLRENTFSKNEYISDNLRTDVKFMVNAIKAIGDNTLIFPNKEITAMSFEIPLNYVSSEIFYRLNVRANCNSQIDARGYLKDFIAAFFRLIPNDVIEKYDTLYEKREKARKKNASRDIESGEIRIDISRDKREAYGGKSLALVSRLVKKDLPQEIGYIIHCFYKGQKFCFESFANWKKAIIAFLNIDGKLTQYEDGDTPKAILKEISNERHIKDVEKSLYNIDKHYNIRKKNKVEASGIFFKFLDLCPAEYLNDKYKRIDPKSRSVKISNRKEFKDLCFQYFGLEPNSIKPKDCAKVLNTDFNSYEEKVNVWEKIDPTLKIK